MSGNRIAEIRYRTDVHSTADEYRTHLRQLFADVLDGNFWERVQRVIFSTVVPPLETVLRRVCADLPSKPAYLSISAGLERDFELDLPFPDQLGADRLANVAGALCLSSPPLLIVDAGTATTFCLVDHRKAYIGGAIVPGLDTSWRALQSHAARLFSVKLRRPDSTVGNTTEAQLQSGVLQGYEALIEGLDRPTFGRFWLFRCNTSCHGRLH